MSARLRRSVTHVVALLAGTALFTACPDDDTSSGTCPAGTVLINGDCVASGDTVGGDTSGDTVGGDTVADTGGDSVGTDTTDTGGGGVTLPFAIDDYYAASGYFPAGEATNIATAACPSRAGDEVGLCHGFTWTPGAGDFAGVWWQYPEGNWGDDPGLVVPAGAKAITFWAWGASGGETVKFVSGYASDGFERDTGEITLTTTPTEYTLVLDGATYTDIAGGFGWVATGAAGGAAVTLYVDDIEMTDAGAAAGCTDPLANNYDDTAEVDDGSCTYDAVALPFAIDAWYAPSGYFPAAEGDNIDGTLVCPERAGDELGDCHGFSWTPGTEAFAGVWWQFPDGNWGDGGVDGLAVDAGATAITFWAWGQNGGEVVKFLSGYPTDGYERDSGEITLTTTPTEYRIDLTGVSYTDIAGGFGWVTANGAVTFYVDDIEMTDEVAVGAGCTDSDATNYDAAATSDDGSCTYDVTFRVDVTGQTATTVYLNGEFNDRCGSCAPMTETATAGVWELTVPLAADTWEYKFTIDGTNWEQVPAACGLQTGDFVNRAVTVVDAPIVLPTAPFGACAPETGVALPFALDDYYGPSGFFPEGEANNVDATVACPMRAGDQAGLCHGFTWTPGSGGFAGVWWQNPDGNWGDGPGLLIAEGATKVTFWAWGATGGEVVKFLAGYPSDGFERDSGEITLTTTPTEYSVNLIGADYTDVAGGFGWVTAAGGVTFYVDDITWTNDTGGEVLGCTDPNANNYDDTATVDDSSCEYDRASLPFVVDDHYVPSGFMGDGESGGIVQDATPCPERAGDARGDCHSAVYTPGGAGWGGVFWQFPEDNWGDLPGLPIDPGATKITLWAWGAVGGEKVRFIAGYASDGFERTTSVITLSTTPTAYVVDLAGTTYDDVAGGFGWVAEAPTSGTVAFYIDDIAWTADPAGVGCTDADAANYDAAATSDDGSCRYDVTFSVDVSAQGLGDADVVYVSGDFQSELDQAFSDWCGGCTPLVKGADGVWSGTFAVPPGTYAYKFQVNEWASDEAVPTECGVTDGGFTNRGLVVVDAPVVLPTPAWGGCAVAPPAGDILLLTFDDATSTDGWQKVANADSAEGTLAWVDGGGNPGGALEVGGVNTGTDGKAYIFQYLASGLDYGGATSVTVSFDVKVATPLVGAALHLQTEIAGVGVKDELDLQNAGISDTAWTSLSFDYDGVAVDASTLRFQLNIASGAFVGAGGGLYLDNVRVAPKGAGVGGCTDDDATNYDAAATSDDGSCRYDVAFSVDASALGLADTDVVYVSGDFQSEVDPTFGDWCGGCTPLTKGADGVWSGTFAIPAGTYAYKFQVNEWQSDESVPVECGVTDGGFTNRPLTVVDAPVDLPLTAWGACAAAPAETEVLALTFDDGASTAGWQKLANADSAEGTLAWADGAGNPGGALDIGGLNTEDAGKAYIFQYVGSGLDYGGGTSVTVSFDVKVSTPLVGAALHLQTEVPGVGVKNEFDLQNAGLSDTAWTPLSFTYDGVAAGAGTFRFQLTFAAGAFSGAGGAVLLDNVRVVATGGGGPTGPTEPSEAAPAPTAAAGQVTAIFSGAYTAVDGVDMNPGWGQATAYALVSIAGDDTARYAGLNYQGIDFAGNPQDVSGRDTLHIDYWTAAPATVRLFLISPGPVEASVTLPTTEAAWKSLDIPLSSFTGVDLSHIIQLKLDDAGSGEGATIFVDNIYFTTSL